MDKKFLKLLVQTASVLLLSAITTSLEAVPQFFQDSHVAAYTPETLTLTLEDGSEWTVPHSDRYVSDYWYAYSSIVPVNITPNTSDANYGYCLVHQYRSHKIRAIYVRANLVKPPEKGSTYAVTLTGFDTNAKIYLSNGTIWKVSSDDRDLTRDWQLDDSIIVGKNTEWFTNNTHILIHASTNTFVRVERIDQGAYFLQKNTSTSVEKEVP